ncbi:MAG: hypothetical protein QOH51_2170 [Acidobacteriota bacterium]|jgi:hypothetical protein|nr:hypothetical protein [Acidobacteriota bacterium]
MKLIHAFAPANQSPRFLGLMMILLCITAPAVSLVSADDRHPNLPSGRAAHDRTLPYPARGYALTPYAPRQNQNQHPRAFVLEGIYSRDDERYTSKAPVEVYRNGQKLELRPGDELQEGDRIRSEPRMGSTVYSGASVVIYNTDGEPVLMVGHSMGVDFTLSKLGFRQSNVHGAKVEIINHYPSPPVVESIDTSVSTDGAELAIYKEDGTRERPATQKEVDNFAMQMDLDEDHPFRRDARLMRASRIIKEGRKAAEQEYTQVESELIKDDEKRQAEEETAKQKDKQQGQPSTKNTEGENNSNEDSRFSLSGTWKCDDGGTYVLTQSGSSLTWEATSPDEGKTWDHTFTGEIEDNEIQGSFKDHPPGIVNNHGRLTFKVISNNRLERTFTEAPYGCTVLVRQ